MKEFWSLRTTIHGTTAGFRFVTPAWAQVFIFSMLTL
jgi:hypothetical protein